MIVKEGRKRTNELRFCVVLGDIGAHVFLIIDCGTCEKRVMSLLYHRKDRLTRGYGRLAASLAIVGLCAGLWYSVNDHFTFWVWRHGDVLDRV